MAGEQLRNRQLVAGEDCLDLRHGHKPHGNRTQPLEIRLDRHEIIWTFQNCSAGDGERAIKDARRSTGKDWSEIRAVEQIKVGRNAARLTKKYKCGPLIVMEIVRRSIRQTTRVGVVGRCYHTR